MRIPLDYYRILGLPIQATAEQLQQAHRDRAMQLPRREYSEAAIAARKQLLDEAYAVLSNPEQRRLYDASFLARAYDSDDLDKPELVSENGYSSADPTFDPYAPSIEIQEPQLVGALLILLELGEYELVLKLGHPYITSSSLNLNHSRTGQPDIVRADIVLTVAFAYLELGREQWQQGQYENAAESLEAGQELLLREGIFASVRGEMQADLYKLRPYRILELLALPEEHEMARRQGVNLLRDMLQDRGGIDGTGDDQSGLSVDDFLRFIQQLRSYLTAAEQQGLFEAEARRPSAVATYLAVYALLARGFAYRQPALIRRAKLLLSRLGTRQDVHLEQAVCALLLGQTEEASRALELSQEYESLAFIREHSQGSPDLLPGLCLYGERWLQNEVFPHFRDLLHQQASLKDYFADDQVQAYLEELPNEPEPASQWETAQPAAYGQTTSRSESSNGAYRGDRYERTKTPAGIAGGAAAATMESSTAYGSNGTATTVPTAERVSQLSPEGRLTSVGGGSGRSRPSASSATSGRKSTTSTLVTPGSGLSKGGFGRRSPRLDRLMFVLAVGVVGLGVLWILFNWFTKAVFGGPRLEGEQLQIGLNQPPIPIPDPNASPTPDPNGPLTVEDAKGIVDGWLKAKAAANGKNHEIAQLSQILTEPELSNRRQDAEGLKQEGTYGQYRHSVEDVKLIPSTPANPNQAQIEAVVTESAEFYQNDTITSTSDEEKLYVRYDLVRQNGQWRIQGISASSDPFPDSPAATTSTETDAAETEEPEPSASPIGDTTEPPADAQQTAPSVETPATP